ncbi:MAG: CtsR family transcriptional regulator [Firmicutes bacterium]|jgi:transcriptional regulator CtsR|nr:CtsR family transcriptional regulator [Bacillota bacterium]
MGTLADHIEAYIKQMLRENQGRAIELSRAQLADVFACVPSQINYVLATRFSLERGYIVESRRGGGGYIRIGRVQVEDVRQDTIELLNQIGQRLSERQMNNVLARLIDHHVLNARQAGIIRGIVQQECANIGEGKDVLRASLVRAMLLLILEQGV